MNYLGKTSQQPGIRLGRILNALHERRFQKSLIKINRGISSNKVTIFIIYYF